MREREIQAFACISSDICPEALLLDDEVCTDGGVFDRSAKLDRCWCDPVAVLSLTLTRGGEMIDQLNDLLQLKRKHTVGLHRNEKTLGNQISSMHMHTLSKYRGHTCKP